jgi:VIT1/CCC1 family predicted Fe2+/Mn2+ transporter
MVNQSQGVAAFVVGIIVPVLLWVLFIPNGAENPANRIWVYLSCIALSAGAAWFTGKNLKWAATGGIVGAVLATLLCFAF